jgi:hypothetical protein
MMILEYGCVEDYLASKRPFSGQFLGLMNNPVLIRYHFDYESVQIWRSEALEMSRHDR